MAAVLPRNLALIIQRLANFNRTTIRIRPQSNDVVPSGSTVVFRLPTNTLVDLNNFQITGTCRYHGADTQLLGLPQSFQQCIERMDVVVNGQVITGNNADYGALHAILTRWLGGVNHMNIGSFIESGASPIGPEWLANARARAVVGPPAAYTTPSAVLFNNLARVVVGGSTGANFYDVPMVINGLLGFLGGNYVRYIDTAVLGPVEIRIRLHSNRVMWSGVVDYNGTTPMDYSFRNLHMMLDTVSFTDDFYRAILARRLLDGGLITIPYQNYFSFQKAITSTSDTHTFNLAAQSLDYLLTTFRSSSFNSTAQKKWDLQTENSTYYTFVSGAGQTLFPSTSYQFLVNNALHPTFPADVNESYSLTRAAFDQASDYGNTCTVQNALDQYRLGRFLFAQCFKHHAEGDKVISGMDTRGASSNMQLMVNNLVNLPTEADLYGAVNGTTNYNNIVWAVTTSTLEISAGQNVVCIF